MQQKQKYVVRCALIGNYDYVLCTLRNILRLAKMYITYVNTFISLVQIKKKINDVNISLCYGNTYMHNNNLRKMFGHIIAFIKIYIIYTERENLIQTNVGAYSHLKHIICHKKLVSIIPEGLPDLSQSSGYI